MVWGTTLNSSSHLVWVMQQDSDPKHTNKSTTEQL